MKHLVSAILMLALGALAFGQRVTSLEPTLTLLAHPGGHGAVVFFIATDCPASNTYSKEIERIVTRYSPKGFAFRIAYEDLGATNLVMLRHAHQYGHTACPIVSDSRHLISKKLGATVTPEVCVLDSKGAVRYLGRIDDLFAFIGVQRVHPSQHDLENALDAVLLHKPVPNPVTKPVGCFIPQN
jgi:hypothetical protein